MTATSPKTAWNSDMSRNDAWTELAAIPAVARARGLRSTRWKKPNPRVRAPSCGQNPPPLNEAPHWCKERRRQVIGLAPSGFRELIGGGDLAGSSVVSRDDPQCQAVASIGEHVAGRSNDLGLISGDIRLLGEFADSAILRRLTGVEKATRR